MSPQRFAPLFEENARLKRDLEATQEKLTLVQPHVRLICDILVEVMQEGGWAAWRERDPARVDEVWAQWVAAHDFIENITNEEIKPSGPQSDHPGTT